MYLEAIIDYMVANGKSQGEIAAALQTNGRLDVGSMRPFVDIETGKTCITVHIGGDPKNPENYKDIAVNTSGVLRPSEWKQLDEAVQGAATLRKVGIADLESRGLMYNLGNGMGTTVLENHTLSDAFEAELTMDGVSKSKGDRPVYAANYLPIPIIHVDYEINARVLAASRTLGNPLDTTSAELAAEKVAETLESMLFTNRSYAAFGGTIYSYVNFPQRNLATITPWDGSGVTGADIIDMVRDMKQRSINARHRGPWVLYIPTDYETILDKDYDATTPGTTIRERILKIDGIVDVKVVDYLAEDNVLLVQMTKNVVRLVKGMPITAVQWSSEGNFVNKYKVMTIQVPQIRADFNGKTGIVHGSV